MTPILFDGLGPLLWGETPDFNSGAICFLADCLSCTVTEERNAGYECVFTYPASGKHFSEIGLRRIIYCEVNDDGERQPFVIYYCSKPISGVVTYYAYHVSYALNETIINPFTVTGTASDALTGIIQHKETGYWFPWTVWSDITTTGTFATNVPVRARSALYGMDGSIVDTFGGEFEFDIFAIKLHKNRGADNGVELRYGKNILDITDETDGLEVFNVPVAYWTDGEAVTVYTPVASDDWPIIQHGYWTEENGVRLENDNGVDIEFYYSMPVGGLLDMTDAFENEPTVEQLEAAAVAKMNAEQPWMPNRNIKVDFVSLAQTDGYERYAALEHVKLCDTVHVYYPDLMISATAKVVKTVYNVLIGKYDDIEIGMVKPTLRGTIV